MTAKPRHAVRVACLAGLALGALWALSMAQVTTRQGVNFQLSVREIPLYAKAIAFLHRDVEYGLLAREITTGLHTDPERVRAIFAWTRSHIRRTPKDWPVLDDHVLNIIIRGHGLDDQMADVFTTLTTYAGLPAFWRPGPVVFSFVRVDGRWAVFDVANGLAFTDASGAFLDAEELLRHPERAQAVAGSLSPGGVPYRRYVERLGAFTVPEVLRAEQQRPWPRLLVEIRRALHWRPAASAARWREPTTIASGGRSLRPWGSGALALRRSRPTQPSAS